MVDHVVFPVHSRLYAPTLAITSPPRLPRTRLHQPIQPVLIPKKHRNRPLSRQLRSRLPNLQLMGQDAPSAMIQILDDPRMVHLQRLVRTNHLPGPPHQSARLAWDGGTDSQTSDWSGGKPKVEKAKLSHFWSRTPDSGAVIWPTLSS